MHCADYSTFKRTLHTSTMYFMSLAVKLYNYKAMLRRENYQIDLIFKKIFTLFTTISNRYIYSAKYDSFVIFKGIIEKFLHD